MSVFVVTVKVRILQLMQERVQNVIKSRDKSVSDLTAYLSDVPSGVIG